PSPTTSGAVAGSPGAERGRSAGSAQRLAWTWPAVAGAPGMRGRGLACRENSSVQGGNWLGTKGPAGVGYPEETGGGAREGREWRAARPPALRSRRRRSPHRIPPIPRAYIAPQLQAPEDQDQAQSDEIEIMEI